MNTHLHDMGVETFAQLNALKALPEKATSGDVRYAANHIVRKSPFAKFFKALGITNGSTLKRSFDGFRSPLYLAAIAHMYYLEVLGYGDEYMLDLNTVFDRKNWVRVARRAFMEFTYMESAIKHNYFLSQSKGYKHNNEVKRVLKTFEELTPHSYSAEAIYNYITSKLLNPHPAHVALMVSLMGLPEYEPLKEWFVENRSDIIKYMVLNGSVRNFINNCHGISLKSGNLVFPTTHLEDRFNKWTGVSHGMINKITGAYQAACREVMRRMDNCELLDDLTLNIEKISEKLMATAINANVTASNSLSEASVPPAVTHLANSLARKHGSVTITNEASGLHIYLADPDLLHKDGRKELASKHLAVNAEKYLGIGRYDVFSNPTKENKILYSKYYVNGISPPCAISMKTKKIWSVHDLLTMLPIDKRMPELADLPKTVVQTDPNKHLVYDANGNLVPRWVGKTIPLTELPEDHPAIVYLKNRGYDIKMLSEIYDVSYCIEEEPENRATGVYYARLPAGRRNSTACRLIFPIYDDKGVRHGWQARCIDITDVNGEKWLWTDRGDWLQITKGGEDQWVSEEFPKGFKAIQKYKNALGSSRNSLLFGLKQAIEWNKDRPPGKKFCVLVEGPLDVGKGGPPCIALLGKSMSPEQASKIRAHFDVVGIVADKDEAGKQCLQRVRQQMTAAYNIIELQTPEGCKDLGDCTIEQANQIIKQCDPIKQ